MLKKRQPHMYPPLNILEWICVLKETNLKCVVMKSKLQKHLSCPPLDILEKSQSQKHLSCSVLHILEWRRVIKIEQIVDSALPNIISENVK